jgi:hypothetical protein
MPSDTPDLAQMRAEMLMKELPTYGNDGMDMFQRDPSMQQVGLFGKKPPAPKAPPVELADPTRRAFFRMPTQDQLPAVVPSPIAPKPGNLPMVPAKPSAEALMPPTPNVAPPTQPEQPGVLESLANKALETPMSRRGFLETTGRAAASQMLRPKIDLGLFNESPLTQAAELAPQAAPMSIATAAANFVSKQLNSPEFDSVTDKIKGILQENGYENYADELDEEPSLLFSFIEPYMEEYEPGLRNQIVNVIDNFIGVKRLAEDSGIPLDVLHSNGITDISLQSPLEDVSQTMRGGFKEYIEDGDAYGAVQSFGTYIVDEDMERIIDAELSKYPKRMTLKKLEDEGAIDNIYNDVRDLFVQRYANPTAYKSSETTPHDLLHEELHKKLSEVGVKDLTNVAHHIFGLIQDTTGPFEELIRTNISLRRKNKPLKSVNDILDVDDEYDYDE